VTTPAQDPPHFDVLTMGRVGVDLYPSKVGVPLAQIDVFHKFLGGTATNVAVAAARHGRHSAVITRTGADPMGEFVHDALRGFGVDDRYVSAVADLPTPIVFCELFPPDHFPIYFYRYPRAPDVVIRAEELDLDAIAAAEVFWVTGTGLSVEPSRTATLAALEHRAASAAERGAQVLTVLDLDFRPDQWPDLTQTRAVYQQALRHVTVAVGNRTEVEVAVGTDEPAAAAAALLDLGVRLAVVKQGPAGTLARDADGNRVEVAPVPVEVVNGLGAGDAFGGALCHGLLAGWPLAQTVTFANAAGAYNAGQLACSSAMPTTAQVQAMLAGAS